MQRGEIITLGRHRLMCGDATNPEDVNALIAGERVNLVLTDPPYGMKCQNKDGSIGGSKRLSNVQTITEHFKNGKTRTRDCIIYVHEYPQIIGDDNNHSAKKFYEIIKDYTATKIFWGGQYFADFLPISGGWIFWDKNMPEKVSFSAGELAWCSKGKQVKKYKHQWSGCFKEGNYTLNPKPMLHPTQKPVELHARILEDFSKPGDIVLDCFGGSGTTLIACEITDRTCYMMEISEEYCEVIRNRYEKLTAGQIKF